MPINRDVKLLENTKRIIYFCIKLKPQSKKPFEQGQAGLDVRI